MKPNSTPKEALRQVNLVSFVAFRLEVLANFRENEDNFFTFVKTPSPLPPPWSSVP